MENNPNPNSYPHLKENKTMLFYNNGLWYEEDTFHKNGKFYDDDESLVDSQQSDASKIMAKAEKEILRHSRGE